MFPPRVRKRVCRDVAGVVITVIVGLIPVGHKISFAIASRIEARYLRTRRRCPLSDVAAAFEFHEPRCENSTGQTFRRLRLVVTRIMGWSEAAIPRSSNAHGFLYREFLEIQN